MVRPQVLWNFRGMWMKVVNKACLKDLNELVPYIASWNYEPWAFMVKPVELQSKLLENISTS